MKNKDYWGDPRYFKLWEKMEMLGIKDVSSPCQEKRGTVVWQLPIINTYKGKFIKVASYETGYVRVLNTCMSPYYINKPVFSHVSRAYSSKKPKLIPIEIDRLEYLIAYCLKNYYIKHANFVADGEYIHKSQHRWELEEAQNKMEEICHLDANAPAKIKDLENKLDRIKAFLKHEL